MDIIKIIADELKVKQQQVGATVELLDGDATVPFIARYRKEATGGLDDTQLRTLEQRLIYLRELAVRKEVVLNSIKEQGKLTPELEQQINTTIVKSEVEDLYLPYKPKRRTKSQIAIEAGLEPLALSLLNDANQEPEVIAQQFLNPDKAINTATDALDGAKHILMDIFSENAEITQACRKIMWDNAVLESKKVEPLKTGAEKFSDYFEYSENIRTIPSHRALAMFRGRQLEILRLQLVLDEALQQSCKQLIVDKFNIKTGELASHWLLACVDWAWKIKLVLRLEVDLFTKLREEAESEAVNVFATNLHHLLMAAPAGAKVTMGLDPGFRTGVKVAIVDATGKLLIHTAIFPHAPQQEWNKALNTLKLLCEKFKVELISIGNGTASRETDKLAIELIKSCPVLKMTKLMVSEAGASVYSASELAAKEFPDLDVSYRGAVSIARRLQDPLAELVKIDPKAIGVGQYQHDVDQFSLAKKLDNTVEDCVNHVGVDLNTASVALLTRISGLNQSLANNIVEYRNTHGSFKNRECIKSVPRIGDKTYQQCAGFLRITTGDNPLDASAVHPEAYPLVLEILHQEKLTIKDLIGNKNNITKINPIKYTTEIFGLPTVKDILNELHKPGRDPRPEFKTAIFKDGVETIKDLIPGMQLEGVVTNVTPFGAFVDIGVHQDGLVHKSMMADRFVENPNEIVKVGQVIKVQVIEVDKQRNRIGLSMKSLNKNNAATGSKANNYKKDNRDNRSSVTNPAQPRNSSMANALMQAFNKTK